MKFIDLFAGIGGFHIALKELGHECVFASELSTELRKLYKINHNIECFGDITKINVKNIPEHDILCAGFPCQTFSKAGNQKGMKEARGKLFYEIIKILKYHKPRYFILENVRNIISHDKGNTWHYISEELTKLGYFIDKNIYSPHHINIPQHRERVFIVGSLIEQDIKGIKWFRKQNYRKSINSIMLDTIQPDTLEKDKLDVLKIWQNFISLISQNIDIPLPLWSMEFGADYPINERWDEMKIDDWRNFKGSFGQSLEGCNTLEDVFRKLPHYVISQKGYPPKWKQLYIQKNRKFYLANKILHNCDLIDKIKAFKQESWQKFEWNAGNENRMFNNKIIQFRGSGIRVKRDDYFPSLVTVASQIPIVGKFNRYLTPKEASILQSLPKNIILPESNAAAFRTLGNMVNIELVKCIVKLFIKNELVENS